MGWSRVWEASKFRVYHGWQPLQNGYLVGMWINIVQVGPSISGAGILSVARGTLPRTLTYLLSYRQRKEHTGTVITTCVSESVNECASERSRESLGTGDILLPTCIV